MPPTDPTRPSFRITEGYDWTNRHENVSSRLLRLYEVRNAADPEGDPVTSLGRTASLLCDIIGEAIDHAVTIRAVGAGWSLSSVASTGGYMVDTKRLNWIFRLGDASRHPSYSGDPDGLIFLQNGMSVYEASKYLDERYGRALKTTGASNGQTIAGAISTGTHGSAFSVGSMQDFVVGIHLVTGPDEHLWLERASQPAASDAFVDRLGARLVRNDALFNAAVVSFGSFGIVQGYLVETVPIYLLEAYQSRVPYDAALKRALRTLDFAELSLPAEPEDPHHFEIVIDPHHVGDGVWLRVMYRIPMQPYTPPDPSSAAHGPGDDLLAVIGTLAPLVPGSVPTIVGGFASRFLQPHAGVTGKNNEIFSLTKVHGKGMSIEIGVPLERAADAIEVVGSAAAQGPFPGFIGVRFVRRSAATLSLAHYPMTCTIEMQGAYSTLTSETYQAVWTALDAAEIPFTQHWGQMGDFSAARIVAAYGAQNVSSWRSARQQLMSADARRAFTNEFLRRTGM